MKLLFIWKLKVLGCFLCLGRVLLGWSSEKQNQIFFRVVEKWIL